MKQNKQAAFTDEELRQEAKKYKPTQLYDAVIFGLLIGIVTYSAINNGLGLFTFLPLLYLPVAARNKKKRDELERMLKERGLK